MTLVRMMLVNAVVIILGLSLAQAYVHDLKRIRRNADNSKEVDMSPEDEDDVKEELNREVASVVITKQGDERKDRKAIEKLIKITEADQKQDHHPKNPDERPNYSEDDEDDGDGVDGEEDSSKKRRQKRGAFTIGVKLWQKGIVPYMFDQSTDIAEDHARAVMNYIEQATCVRFIKYYPGVFEDNGLTHENVLKIGEYGGCWSYVGQLNKNISQSKTQALSACAKHHGTFWHEVLHALGSQHEQHRNDKDSIFQIYRNNVKPDSFNWREVTSYKNTNNTFAYSLDSTMQYGTFTGNMNGHKTMITYDKDVAYIDFVHDGFVRYLDGQIVNSLYKCQERRCPNHPHTCKNRGYVAYLNDAECRCVCPRGLGGDTCEEEYVPEPISSWPSGSYCLAADNTECSGIPFQTGYRKEHMTSLSLRSFKSYFPQDAYNRNKVYTHRFCCSSDETENSVSYDWPPGTYCLYMYNDVCPSGFVNGSLKFDDEDVNNLNELGGDAYPSGAYDNDTTMFQYCCRDDGALAYPMVMQNQQPFTLLNGQYATSCQEVAGMLVRKMTYIFNTFNKTLDVYTPPYPAMNRWWKKKWMHYCHYTPRTYGCGGVETLDDSQRSITIKSPNYPNTYSPNTVCSWTIKSPENTLMKVEFTHFNITIYSNGDCEYDFLEVRHWNPESAGRKFCGDQFPRGMVTYQNQMMLELQTSDLTPATGFEATISIVEATDFKFRTSTSYAGNVSYTQQYEKCLRWDEVPQCPHNMFSDTTGLLGAHNYCRNPVGQFSRPWCYVNAYCYSDICDVGGIVDCYDKSESCATLINDTYCASDAGFEHCHKSCGFCGKDIEKPADCAPPAAAESMVMTSEAKDLYLSGDVIKYKEKYTEVTQERVCLTTGEWTGSDDMFSGCPYGWVESAPGLCFKFFDNKLNFNNAQRSCASYGGRLAIASTEDEHRALEVVLPNPRVGVIRTYLGLRENFNPNVYQWIDGRNLTYSKWLNSNIGKTCVTLITSDGSYYWDDVSWCGWSYFYACERFLTCGDGYYASGDGVCYKYHGEDPKSRDAAQAVCESEGGQLAVGSTEQEHYAIVAVLPYPASQRDFTYFGLKQNDAATFEWNNGSPVSFAKWAPDTFIGTDECAALRWINKQKAYMWDDVGCGGSYPFVCQKPQASSHQCSDSDKDCTVFMSDSTLCAQQDRKLYAHLNCRQTCGLCE